MEPERDRDRHVAGRRQLGGDLEAVVGQLGAELEHVREREAGHQLLVRGVVEPAAQPRRLRLEQLPVRRPGHQPVDGQAVRVRVDVRGAQVERDPAAGDLVLRRSEPVGPRVQQRDRRRLAGAHVVLHRHGMRHDLVAVVSKRPAEHAHAGYEGGLQATARGSKLGRPAGSARRRHGDSDDGRRATTVIAGMSTSARIASTTARGARRRCAPDARRSRASGGRPPWRPASRGRGSTSAPAGSRRSPATGCPARAPSRAPT